MAYTLSEATAQRVRDTALALDEAIQNAHRQAVANLGGDAARLAADVAGRSQNLIRLLQEINAQHQGGAPPQQPAPVGYRADYRADAAPIQGGADERGMLAEMVGLLREISDRLDNQQ